MRADGRQERLQAWGKFGAREMGFCAESGHGELMEESLGAMRGEEAKAIGQDFGG